MNESTWLNSKACRDKCENFRPERRKKSFVKNVVFSSSEFFDGATKWLGCESWARNMKNCSF